MVAAVQRIWRNFQAKHPAIAQFLVFFVLSNGVTLLQMVLMPVFKGWFSQTGLIGVDFQVGRVGWNFDGSPYYIFNYDAGEISNGGGGGLAYFLAVQITMAIAQVINFFLQRRVTFKSNGSVAKAALWYALAYVVITVTAAAAQSFYKAPIYRLFITTLGWGVAGEAVADVLTMIINCAISFWIFFPIFRIIFRSEDPKAQSLKEGGKPRRC